MFEEQREPGYQPEQRLQEPGGFPGGAEADGDAGKPAVDGHAHAVVPLVDGVLNTEAATEHNFNRKTVVKAFFFHAVIKLFIKPAAHVFGKPVFLFGESVGVFASTETAFDFEPPDVKRVGMIDIGRKRFVFVAQRANQRRQKIKFTGTGFKGDANRNKALFFGNGAFGGFSSFEQGIGKMFFLCAF